MIGIGRELVFLVRRIFFYVNTYYNDNYTRKKYFKKCLRKTYLLTIEKRGAAMKNKKSIVQINPNRKFTTSLLSFRA